MTLPPVLWAIPTEINYQGTLKKNGLPDIVQEKVTFQLTNSDGSIQYSQPTTVTVTPINGLFSAKLDFQFINGNTWESVTPYIQVSVGGQVLSNPEKVSATIYSVIASSVVAGGVTTNAIAAGAVEIANLDPNTVQAYLIPSGMIAMFAASCPAGWNIYGPLQGKFPVGTDNNTVNNNFPIASSGGQLNHVHTFTTSTNGAHNHGGSTSEMSITGTRVWAVGDPSFTPTELMQDVGTNAYLKRYTTHDHTIASDGDHKHTGTTDPTSSLPPYLTVVFCIKQ